MKPFQSFSRNHSNARASQTLRKRRFQSRKNVRFPNFMSLGRCQLLHRYIYTEWTNAFSCFSLFSYSRLSPRITTKKNFHMNTPNLNFKMRHIWILNNKSSKLRANKWLQHFSGTLFIENSGRVNYEHQLDFKCSFIVQVWKTNWFFTITSSHLPPITKRKC